MVNDQRIIILFVKYPEEGRVKTRLARTLGDEKAVSIYCQLVVWLIRMLRGVSVEEVRVCFDPADKRSEVEAWLRPLWIEAGEAFDAGKTSLDESALVFRPQCSGHLGERLKSAFSEVFEENESSGISKLRVLAIGSDCIEIDGHTFQQAWEFLQTKDVVFGPTVDGGYYLIGMKAAHPELFADIPWSTEMTLQVSLQRARESALESAVLDEKHDIDTEEDWRRVEENRELDAEQ